MATTNNDWRNDAFLVSNAIEWHAKRLGVAVDYKTARRAGRKTVAALGYPTMTANRASELALDWIANNTVCPE